MSTTAPSITETIEFAENGAQSAVITMVHPSGRELVVTVTLTVPVDGDGTLDPDALVVFLDTPDWEPTPDLLRVNVNDGHVWNYSDTVRYDVQDCDECGEPIPADETSEFNSHHDEACSLFGADR